MQALFAKAKKLACDAGLGLSTATIKVALVTGGYTPDLVNHQFYSDLTPASNVLGTPQALTYSSDTGGTLKVTGTATFSNVPAGTVKYLVYYLDTGTTTTSPLLGITDGTFTVTAAVLANTGATSVTVDPLAYAIASGASFTFGAVTATLTAGAAAAARSIAVSATSGGIAQNATGSAPISGVGLPVTSTGSSFTIVVTPDAANGVFTL